MSSIIFSCMHFCVNPRKVGERYQLLIVIMIYRTELGNFWNRTCRDSQAFGALPPVAIVCLSTLYCWILRTGAPWGDLSPDYGEWKNTHRRFCRWRGWGSWERLLEIFVNEPDCEWLMIDARHIKVHPYAVGARPQMPQKFMGV